MAKNNKIQKKELFFLFILILFHIFTIFYFLFTPLNKEESKLSQIAAEIKLGKIPYKDIANNTPPLNYYLYITAYNVFNFAPEHGRLRMFTIAYIMFFIFLIYIISRLMAGNTVAMLSSFFYVILIWKNPYSGIFSLPGLFAQFPIFLSLLFLIFIEKEYERVDYFLSGFFLSVASYVVFPIKFIIFIPAIYIVLIWKKKADRFKYIFWFFSGFIFMDLLAFLWAAKNLILKEFVQFYFINNFLSFFDKTNLNTDYRSIFLNRHYLLFISIFLIGFYRMLIIKNFDCYLLLFFISISIGVIALFQKGTNTGFIYILIPFISIMISIFLKEFILWIKKNNIA